MTEKFYYLLYNLAFFFILTMETLGVFIRVLMFNLVGFFKGETGSVEKVILHHFLSKSRWKVQSS